ncbi:putative Heavy metal transport/detoxification superfamily protein [Hibiscus syriacus]|uniref:Heavy metal transport/detoxification superfamily protein n=1 Tax=Hibiscus syriacus TaxID=106335 RepID=A0A6A3AN02_HIBSY|nr:putative Heavy metal transport/detoxification superfamily protein [Hibiscus syriacus]
MGGQSDLAVHSSIALLQERFRRLQRAKEMRQEREVLRLLSEAERINPAAPHQVPQSFFHSELILQPRPSPQGSIYCQTSIHDQHQVIDTSSLSSLRLRDAAMHVSTFNDSDVDTSLHL